MLQTPNKKYNKIELLDSPPDITVINPNWDSIDADMKKLEDEKVDKVSGKGLSTNDYTTAEKQKLAGIDEGANNYVHPNDANTRHVKDSEKTTWNAKETPAGAQEKATKALNDAKKYTDDVALLKADNIMYNNNLLQLTSNGTPIGDKILITGGSGGTKLNVFRSSLATGGSFVATVDGTDSFTIEGLKANDLVRLNVQKLVPVLGVDYSVDTSTGVVTFLTFTMNKNEKVYYEIESTSNDYNDLINTPNIANNLVTTSEGSILDARQGKVLDGKISDLASPYLILEGEDLPVNQRKKGKMYFKVTSEQSGGLPTDTIKVSPTMGIKIQ